MTAWWRKKDPAQAAHLAAEAMRSKYATFRQLLALNNEILELMASLQEDLQFVPPLLELCGTRVEAVFDKAQAIVQALEKLSGHSYASLAASVKEQRHEVETYLAAAQELTSPRLAVWLSEVDSSTLAEVGGKAASLGEIKNKLNLPVPDGFVLTAQAYRQFCGIPLWAAIREAIRNADLNDLDALRAVSGSLTEMVMNCPIPRAVEVAITERALRLETGGLGLAVRSSALVEGGERTFAGQFVSLINVPNDQLIEAYKRVVAGRFSERALSYRLSTGFTEAESPLAVLFLPVIRARAAGIMYTRDPKDPKSKSLWVTSTHGLALDIASGPASADLFVLSRGHTHAILEEDVVEKSGLIMPRPGGGLDRTVLTLPARLAPSLDAQSLHTLAEYGQRIEEHFKAPQDVEWAVDELGKVWILQSRALKVAQPLSARERSKVKAEPLLAGGRTVYPGRASGPAHLVEVPQALNATPEGAILFLRRPSPEIVEVFPRIGGLVAQWGNLAGHAATLLREFRIPSVFGMAGGFEALRAGEPVSLDAIQPRLYRGSLWPERVAVISLRERFTERQDDPISRRLLTLHLLDPGAFSFRPAGCKSAHDVLRFCHEKAIEAMFALNDSAMEIGPQASKRLLTPMPIRLYVLDLGGGLAEDAGEGPEVEPEKIVSRPFQALWRGVSHPAVTWKRDMPARLSDFASVMAGSFSGDGAMRGLGERSYVLVADEYMNLNSRLAYHYSLVDACLSDVPGNNYISFRFAGGGATRDRRNLRACFIEACLSHHGFKADRRGDLVNAWLRKAPAEVTAEKLDILGRLMACSSQLDMYMTSHEAMKWYVQQFLAANYAFRAVDDGASHSVHAR